MANNKEIDKQTKNIYRQSVKQIYRHYMTHKCSDLQKRLYEKTAEIKYAQKIKTYFKKVSLTGRLSKLINKNATNGNIE